MDPEVKGLKVAIIISIVLAISGCGSREGSEGQITGGICGKVTLLGKEDHSGVVISERNLMISAVTDKEGRFCIEDIPEGIYYFKFAKKGYKTEVRKITVEAGKVTTLELTLSKPSISAEGYNVAGKVTTSDGADVSSSIVFLKGDEYDSGEEVGSDGSFCFSGVPLGTYIIKVEKYGYRHDPIELFVGGDMDVEVVLYPLSRQIVFFDDFSEGWEERWEFVGSDMCEIRNEGGKIVFDPKGYTNKQFGLVCKEGPFDISHGVLLEAMMEKGEGMSGNIFVILSKRRDISFTNIPSPYSDLPWLNTDYIGFQHMFPRYLEAEAYIGGEMKESGFRPLISFTWFQVNSFSLYIDSSHFMPAFNGSKGVSKELHGMFKYAYLAIIMQVLDEPRSPISLESIGIYQMEEP